MTSLLKSASILPTLNATEPAQLTTLAEQREQLAQWIRTTLDRWDTTGEAPSGLVVLLQQLGAAYLLASAHNLATRA